MKNRDKILDYFDNVADGTVVSANDMYEHGFERMKQEAFFRAVERLADEGEIIRVGRGMYIKKSDAQGDITETAYVLKQLNVKSNSASIPYSFNPVWGKAKTTDSYVELSTAQPDKKRVPNVVGMGAKDAVYLLESYGMKVHLSGVGKVHAQSIPSGSMVRKGEYITLTLKN